VHERVVSLSEGRDDLSKDSPAALVGGGGMIPVRYPTGSESKRIREWMIRPCIYARKKNKKKTQCALADTAVVYRTREEGNGQGTRGDRRVYDS